MGKGANWKISRNQGHEGNRQRKRSSESQSGEEEGATSRASVQNYPSNQVKGIYPKEDKGSKIPHTCWDAGMLISVALNMWTIGNKWNVPW